MKQQRNQSKQFNFPTYEAASQFLANRPQLRRNPLFFDPSVWSWVLVDNNQKRD